MGGNTTSVAEPAPRDRAKAAAPGLVLVFGAGRPQLAAVPIAKRYELGREALAALDVEDKRLSRQHAEVVAGGEHLVVRDLESRNGTFVGGERVTGERVLPPGAVLRVGDSLFVACANVRAFIGASIDLGDDRVLGPRMRTAWNEIEVAAATGETLHVHGETGSGKELAARRFHTASGREGAPFIAVNCATISSTIAERLLFGAKKGSYSGADIDADGYLQAADSGTLFLDEVAELGLEVQAKLLRAIESRSALPVGATRARDIDVRVVTATHRSLRAEAAAGRFREDLYYRIGRPCVELPPLRERREEVPWLLRWMLGRMAPAPKLSPSFVETALIRAWPGNVRELGGELATAVGVAKAAGAATLEALHLAEHAGQPLSGAADAPPGDEEVARIVRALAAHGGKVATTARALGMHRNQLRRLIDRHGLRASSDD
jgi:transcriptional regulator of acetoin/glycerol metabolism